MVKRRPAPAVTDPSAAAAFVDAADTPAPARTVSPPTPADVPVSTGRQTPSPSRAVLEAPGPRVVPADTAAAAPATGEKLPTTMLLRFREPRDEARLIAELAQHYDRSKQYIAYAALVRGLEAMREEAGLSPALRTE